MKKLNVFLLVTALLVLSACENKTDPTADIEGVYKFVSRKLKDGTMQQQPDIKGLMIFLNGYCTVYIITKDAEGTTNSYSRTYSYSITNSQFTATNMFSHIHDGKDVVYELSDNTKTVPVTSKNGSIQYKNPLDEPVLLFKENKLVATGSDFVDSWEKIE